MPGESCTIFSFGLIYYSELLWRNSGKIKCQSEAFLVIMPFSILPLPETCVSVWALACAYLFSMLFKYSYCITIQSVVIIMPWIIADSVHVLKPGVSQSSLVACRIWSALPRTDPQLPIRFPNKRESTAPTDLFLLYQAVLS